MSDDRIIGPGPACMHCFEVYGGHADDCPNATRTTRGTPIEKLSLEIVGTEYEHIRKINEIIDRINAMNEIIQ